jgi:hypothetical protein
MGPSRDTIKNAVLAGAVIIAVGGFSGAAHAVTYSGTFGVSIYQGPGNGDIDDPNNQAEQGNPLLGFAPLDIGTFTGDLKFSTAGSDVTIGDFFSSSLGSSNSFSATTLSKTISTSGFGTTTLFVFTGNTSNILAGVITHDDGMSLYDGVGYSNTVASAPYPVVATPTAYSGLLGDWQLIYAEANGLPAVLNFDITRSEAPPTATPLPAALPLFASGLGGLGLLGWRRKRNNAAALAAG